MKTELTDSECLKKALAETRYPMSENTAVKYQEGGYWKQMMADFVIHPNNSNMGVIAFYKGGETYHFLADWYELPRFPRDAFLAQLKNRYAYHATKKELEAKGFEITSEETKDGTTRLLLMRRVLSPKALETHTVESQIDRDGNVTITVSGTPGTSCLDVTRELEMSLGDGVIERQMTKADMTLKEFCGDPIEQPEYVDVRRRK
jgi:hypothetical protein